MRFARQLTVLSLRLRQYSQLIGVRMPDPTSISLISVDSLPILREASFGSGLTRSHNVNGQAQQERTTGLDLYSNAMNRDDPAVKYGGPWVTIVNATHGDIWVPSGGGYTIPNGIAGIFASDNGSDADIDKPDCSRCTHDLNGVAWKYRASRFSSRADLSTMTNLPIPGITELIDAKSNISTFCGFGGYHWPADYGQQYGGAITLAFSDELVDIHPWLAMHTYLDPGVGPNFPAYAGAGAGHSTFPLDRAALKKKFHETAEKDNLRPTIYWEFDLTSDKTSKDYVRMRGFAISQSEWNPKTAGISCIFERLPRGS